MGTKIFGHILPGAIISGLGMWHLFNHIRLFCLRPDSYVAPVWFPAPRVRYLELMVIIAGSVYGFATQASTLFRPLDDVDGSIPSPSLRIHEHAVINAAFLVYAGSALHLDRVRARGRRALCMLLLAVVFAQELLVFHFHSTDHVGVEGRFHLFVQVIAAACLVTALLGAGFPRSFAVSLVRSACLTFQGVWFIVIGVMWIPRLVAKGCSLGDGGDTMRCQSDASLHRAMAVVNLLFGWCMSLLTLFVVSLYLYVCKKYPAEATYGPLPEAADEEDDLKAQKCGVARSGDDVHEFTTLEIEV